MRAAPRFLALALALAAAPALAGPRDDLIAGFAGAAGITPSAERGHAFFLATPGGGNADTPSCSTCHTADPRAEGRTRAGKAIAPMAVSKTPDRFTDAAKVDKWFRRNCDSVLGRECTAAEKADILTYFASL